MNAQQFIHQPRPQFIDLTGFRFGRLVALRPVRASGKEVRYQCVCDCGKSTTPSANNLRKGHAKSCGCLMIDRTKEKNTKHGKWRTRTYRTWRGMKTRCYWPKADNYFRYGGRGITVCASWRNDFAAFLQDMGEAPLGMQLDRIDNDKGYSKENCRWATPTENSNNRCNTHYLDFNGQRVSVAWLARQRGIICSTFEARLRRGWSVEDAATIPVRAKAKPCD